MGIKTTTKAEKRESIGIDGLFAPLARSTQPCAYGNCGEFRKPDASCAGSVSTEGNRMPICDKHRLASALESLDHIARAQAELYERQTRINMRIRGLLDILNGGR